MNLKPNFRSIEYPSSDGKPMAETDVHRDWMFTIIRRLKRFFRGKRVYVSGNLLVYYVEGDPRRSVAPDTFVVKNCDPRVRRVFKIWEEGRVPNFVLETTSKKTRREDRGHKKALYAQLGIPEYFLYDPLGEWLDPPLQGYRLVGGTYRSIEPDGDGSVQGDELGITFRLENGDLVMVDTATGKRLLDDEEYAAQATKRATRARKRAMEARKQAVEASKRAIAASKRVTEAEKRAAEAEKRLAEEAAARKALEDEIQRLRAGRGRKEQ